MGLVSTPGGQCYSDVAPLACRTGGFTRVQSISYFRSDRSYLARPIQTPTWGVGPSLSDKSVLIVHAGLGGGDSSVVRAPDS